MVGLQTDGAQSPAQVVALVDDEVQIAQAIQTLLSFRGLHSSVHESAESLLDAVKLEHGDLWLQADDGVRRMLTAVVLDLNLPGMNGADLTLALRRMQPRLRLVMITAAMDDKLQERAKDLEGVTVLHKPFSFESLETALQMA